MAGTVVKGNSNGVRKGKGGCFGCLGCLGVVALVLALLAFFGSLLGGPPELTDVSADGTSGQILELRHYGNGIGNTAWEIARDVYRVAVKYPKLRTLVVVVEIRRVALVDKYGRNLVKKRIPIATIRVAHLARVRRYTEAGLYAMEKEGFYKTDLMLSPEAPVLSRSFLSGQGEVDLPGAAK